jgi:hypothetical protein
MKDLEFKKIEKKPTRVFARVEQKTFDRIEALSKKNDVDFSTVVRRLIEIGLENAVTK